jgi:CRP-like cAMP-binding protein
MSHTVSRFEKRDTVFAAGDEALALPKLLSGAVIIFAILPDGRRQVLDLAGPGDFLHFETEGELDHFAEALTPCEVAFYDPSVLLSDSDSSAFLFEQMRERLSIERRHITMLSRKSAAERLADFVHLAADCLGRSGDRFELPLTRQQIADFTGLSLVTVSRTFAGWQRDRSLTKVEGRTYEIGTALPMAA